MDGLSKLFAKSETKYGFCFMLFIAIIIVVELVLYNLAMVNEAVWIGMYFIWFIVLLGMYKIFGKWGLIVAFVLNTTMLNLQVLQVTEIWGWSTAAGGDAFNFLITDILVEKYGKKEGMKCVALGIAAMIVFTALMWYTTLLSQGKDAFVYGEYMAIFGVLPRIAGASLLAFIIAQTNDIIVFSKLRAKTKGKFLWLRNNVSTIMSQSIDLVIFNLTAFWGIIPIAGIIEMVTIGYGVEIGAAIVDTFFIYLAMSIIPLTFMGKDERIPPGIPDDVEA